MYCIKDIRWFIQNKGEKTGETGLMLERANEVGRKNKISETDLSYVLQHDSRLIAEFRRQMREMDEAPEPIGAG